MTSLPLPELLFFREEAYFRQRYAKLWLVTWLRGAYEPVAILAMSIWLSYSSWETAQYHLIEAAILGSILGLSFLQAVAQLSAGLLLGGRWRGIPSGMRWSTFQKFIMVSDTRSSA